MDTYAVDLFHDVPALALAIERRQLRSVAAFSADGTLVGHTGLTVRQQGARITEAGNTVVDPACRGHGLLGRLGAALTELCIDDGFAGYVHYPTTAHAVMQKRSVAGDGVETGLMLAHVPADTDYREFDQGHGRLAVTVVYQPFTDLPPRRVTVPARYLDLLDTLYCRAGLERALQPDTVAARGAARIDLHLQARRSLLHVDIRRGGSDLSTRIAAALAQTPAAIAHADIALDGPGVGSSVEQLRELGFFYSALLPGFGSGDVLRLQRIARPDAATFRPRLANRDARDLLALMRAEFQRWSSAPE